MTGTIENVCPACLADAGVGTGRETLEIGLKCTFECEDCGHVWNIVSERVRRESTPDPD